MSTSEKLEYSAPDFTVEKLANLLKEGGIDTSAWGTGSAKTIAHLLKEVREGESQMTFSPEGITRAVRVAWVDVLYRDEQGDIYLLVEDRQEYNDGRIRRRQLGTSLGEKLKPGEEPGEGAIRALDEELGVHSYQSLHTVGHEHTTHATDSYPGLESSYDTYSFVAILDNTSYTPEGYIETQADKTNYYIWTKIHAPSIDPR